MPTRTAREVMARALVELGAPTVAAALDAIDRSKAAQAQGDPDAWKIIRDVCQGQP